MKKRIYRVIYIIFTILFYYTFLGGFLTFEMPSYPSEVSIAQWSIAPLVPALMMLITLFLTPFIIGLGIFLFFKYPKPKKGDIWHYCLIYPGFAIFTVGFLIFLYWLGIM